jgi:hypothetical protein
MPVTIPDSDTPTWLDYGTARVYTRTTWGAAWTEVPGLHPLEVVWSIAPSQPTALLLWHYGQTWLNEEALGWQTSAKLDLARKFVKIEIDTQPDGLGGWVPRVWVGRAEFCEDHRGGIHQIGGNDVVHGSQKWTCYGIEQLLADHEIRTSRWGTGFANYDIGRALPFNPRIRGRVAGNMLSGEWVFASHDAAAEFWNSDAICNYLVDYQTPRDDAGNKDVPFIYAGGLPTWDRPELEAEGKTTYSLLNQLMDRRRLRCWWCSYDGNTNEVLVDTETLVAAAVTLPLPDDPTIPANTRTVELLFDETAFATAAVRTPAVPLCEQVRARGARRVLVGSFSFVDGTLAKGWETAHQTAYNVGASLDAGYAALKRFQKEQWNVRARTAPLLQNVYAFFALDYVGFGGKTGGGEGSDALKPLFWRDIDVLVGADADAVYPFNFHDLTLRETLPLLEGVNYGAGAIAAGTVDETEGPGRELEPLCFLRKPGTGSGEADTTSRWIRADQAGSGANLEPTKIKDDFRLTCHVRVPPNSKGCYVHTVGQPQHALAFTDFAGLDGIDKAKTGCDYQTGMILTLAIDDDRHVEGVWPSAPATSDATRIRWIDAGETYRETYVAPNTVVDIDTNGTLIKSTGGFLPPRDGDHAAKQLEAIAKLAYAWYGTVHYVLRLDTFYLATPTELDLGMLVTSIGKAGTAHRSTINSIISEIRIEWPWPENSSTPDAPRMSLTTWAGELDAYQLAMRPLESPLRANDARTPTSRF